MGYFTVTVEPTMVASKQHTAAFSAKDLLFDWTSFDVPRGANKLIDVALILRGTDGVYQEKDTVLYFAKSKDSGVTAPTTLGTVNATADGVGYFDHVIGAVQIMTTDFKEGLDSLSVATLGHGAASNHAPSLVLEGEPESGTNVGYDTLYIASTCGALDFRSGMQVNEANFAAGAQTTITVDGVDATLAFAPGDVIHAHDDAVLGTVKSITDANTIVLTAANTAAIDNNDFLYNITPVKVILCFDNGK